MKRPIRVLSDLVLGAQSGIDGGVAPYPSVDGIVTKAASEPVVRGISDDRVAAGSANGVLDRHIEGDREIVHHPANVGIGSGLQIEPLVGGITRRVERIAAARIPD